MQVDPDFLIGRQHADAREKPAERNKGVSFAHELAVAREENGDSTTAFFPLHALPQAASFGRQSWGKSEEKEEEEEEEEEKEEDEEEEEKD